MELWIAVLYLIGGFAFLLIGGEALVRAAISIAVRTNISPAVISLTIIAAGTSAPELVTSLIAAFQQKPDIAVGNVVGSNVFNIFAILGFSFLIKPSRVKDQEMNLEWAAITVASALLLFFAQDLFLNSIEGGVFVFGLVGLLFFSVRNARKKGIVLDDEDEIEKSKSLWLDLTYLTVGFAALVGGAHLALIGGVAIGELAGWSEKVIGLTIVSAGTGLPELATSAVAAFRGRSDIAIGNVVGSNIMNTLGVLGATALVHPLAISLQIVQIDLWILLGATLLVLPVIKGVSLFLGRLGGFTFFTAYVVFIYGTLVNWQL